MSPRNDVIVWVHDLKQNQAVVVEGAVRTERVEGNAKVILVERDLHGFVALRAATA